MSDSSSKPPIARVLAHFYGLELKASRGRVKIACPLPSHPDSNPSASVDLDKDRWNCFACNLSEDSYAVIMREEKLGFTEAKEFARTEFGGDSEEVPRDIPGEPGRGVRSGSGPRGGRRQVRPGPRRFGSTWS
ncbi:DNA primase [Streptomyces phage Success]|uniref:DNA primase n=1 Tax=Streptomyces phage Success TaxID=2999013 RepID=A0A9E8M5W8_9CAUD|nr:DNA primase [Streptomyces phage Success]WAB08817.1 DNA primase [Streptomyces phage Success]